MMLCCAERCREVAEASRIQELCTVGSRPSALPESHRRKRRAAVVRRMVRIGRPVHRQAVGARRARRRGRRRAGGACRGSRFSRLPWRAMTPSERGRVLWRVGDAISGQRAEAGGDRAPRQRQARLRGHGAGSLHGGLLQVLRRIGRQGRERRVADRQEGRLFVHEVLPEGRGRDHHAMELAADPDELEARARAGGGLHRGGQAFRIYVRVDARVRGVVRLPPGCPTAS